MKNNRKVEIYLKRGGWVLAVFLAASIMIPAQLALSLNSDEIPNLKKETSYEISKEDIRSTITFNPSGGTLWDNYKFVATVNINSNKVNNVSNLDIELAGYSSDDKTKIFSIPQNFNNPEGKQELNKEIKPIDEVKSMSIPYEIRIKPFTGKIRLKLSLTIEMNNGKIIILKDIQKAPGPEIIFDIWDHIPPGEESYYYIELASMKPIRLHPYTNQDQFDPKQKIHINNYESKLYPDQCVQRPDLGKSGILTWQIRPEDMPNLFNYEYPSELKK
jgi:hypothetical protein